MDFLRFLATGILEEDKGAYAWIEESGHFDAVLVPTHPTSSIARFEFRGQFFVVKDWRYCPSSLGIVGLVEGRLGACCVVRRYEPLSWVFTDWVFG
ncbi:unnamed protein product, partial [Symbiodinium sp. CCMP2592]